MFVQGLGYLIVDFTLESVTYKITYFLYEIILMSIH